MRPESVDPGKIVAGRVKPVQSTASMRPESVDPGKILAGSALSAGEEALQ